MGYFTNLMRAVKGEPFTPGRSGYAGASQGRRMFSQAGTYQGASALALSDGPRLCSLARKLVMDNPWASNALESFAANAVGTGIAPHSQHPDAETRKMIEREWKAWTEIAHADGRTDTDPAGMVDFYGLQVMVCRGVMEAGEAFARLRTRPSSDGLRVPLQIQLVEPEQLPFWRMSGGLGDNLVRGGIEFDKIGRKVAYHFYKRNPGDGTIWPDTYEIIRTPAAGVLHVMIPLRGNQIRGVTKLAPILVALSDLDQYDDAERYKKKLGAYLFGWYKSLAPDEQQTFQTAKTVGESQAAAGTAFSQLQPGTFTLMDTGAQEEMGFYTPPDVGTQYEAFMRVQLRGIASGLGLTYEQLTGDMTGVNYSSARIALLEFRRRCEQFQFQVLVHQFCRPVWKAWMTAAAQAGVINAREYVQHPEWYLAVDWRAPRWQWVDPLKDVLAEKEAIRCGLKSRSQSIQEQGGDPADVEEEIAAENARADAAGFVFDTDPRRTAANGTAATVAEPGAGTNGDGAASPKATLWDERIDGVMRQ